MNFMSHLTSPGSLRIRVVEGTDLADGLSAHLKQLKLSGSQSFKLHSTFLRVEILDESDSPLQSFTTCSQPYEGKGEINFYNEEFFFEQALPTYSVRVSTCFCQHVSPGVSTDQCAGMMILPLNRLEENIPVVQWYQLTPMDSKDRSIKSAVKFEVCFFYEEKDNIDNIEAGSPFDATAARTSEEKSQVSALSLSGLHAAPFPLDVSVDVSVLVTESSGGHDGGEPSEQRCVSLHPPLTSPADHSTLRITIPSEAHASPRLPPAQHHNEEDDRPTPRLLPGCNQEAGDQAEATCPTASASVSNHAVSRSGAQTTPHHTVRHSSSRDNTHTHLSSPKINGCSTPGGSMSESHDLARRATTTSHLRRHSSQQFNQQILSSLSSSMDYLMLGSGVVGSSSGLHSSTDREKTGVKVGVIQHAVLMGPSTIECQPPGAPDTHTWKDSVAIGQKEQLVQKEGVEEQEKECTGHDMEDKEGRVFAPQPVAPDPPMSSLQQCANICIWDQYPPLSLLPPAQLLPEKLEWFAFPNGPKEHVSRERPAAELSSFVLYSDNGELEIFYCVCLMFYMRGDRASAQHVDGDDVNVVCCNEGWEDADSEDDQSMDNERKSTKKKAMGDDKSVIYNWFGVCLCLMTQSPFVSQLSSVLSKLYPSLIVDALMAREAQASSSSASDDKYSQLQINLCHVLEPLFFDSPLPIPGYMDVSIRFNFSRDNGPTVCDGLDEARSEAILFSLQNVDFFPQCAYSIENCIHLIGARTLVDLLFHVLSEHKILLHSKHIGVPTMICECLRTLLYPLQWSSVYIPTVPSLLLDLVDAPVPFILGICSSDLQYVDKGTLGALVVVDCQTGMVSCPSALTSPCSFAPALDRWCVCAIKAAMISGVGGVGASPISSQRNLEEPHQEHIKPQICAQFGCERNFIFQAIIFDCMLSMLCYLPDCVFNVSSGFPQLNLEMLLEGYSPPSAAKFIRALSSTQAFHRMVSNIHRPELLLFVKCASSLRHVYQKENVDRRNTALSSQMFPLEEQRFYQEDKTKQREKTSRKSMTSPYMRHRGTEETHGAQQRTSEIRTGTGETSKEDVHSDDDSADEIFPHWVMKHNVIDRDIDFPKSVFQVLCRYQEVVGCFNGLCSLFASERPPVVFEVEIKCYGVAEVDIDNQRDGQSFNTAIFPPLCFAEDFFTKRQRYLRHWKLDELMRKLKKQYCDLNTGQVQMWKRLFRLLTTCKVNQKLLQHQRRATENSAEGVSGDLRATSFPPPPPASPSSPTEHAIKLLHYEYMFGPDDITRLVLKILPLRHSDAKLDDELVSTMQFHSQEASGSLFVQGDSRRRVIRALKSYSNQLVINFISSSVYQEKYRETKKKLLILPSTRLRSTVEQYPVELHVIAFGYLHQLFKLLLQACAKHNDYLTAYGALEISGYYYLVHLSDTAPPTKSTTSPAKGTGTGDTPPGILKRCAEERLVSQGTTATSSSPHKKHSEADATSHLVQSLRSRICHDPVFANMNLWLIVMNDVMSAQYVSLRGQDEVDTSREAGANDDESRLGVFDILKPVLTHMIECNISNVKITELLDTIMINFEISDPIEKSEVLNKYKLLWQVGSATIRKACGDTVSSNRDYVREDKLLVVRRLLHSIKDPTHHLTTSTCSDSPMNFPRGPPRTFDFSRNTSPAPPLPVLGPQTSTFSVTPFESDALFATDEDEDARPRFDTIDSESVTDTDAPPIGRVKFSFAGQPRHESSLGSTYPKQLTSMHSACVTALDISESQYDYSLQSEVPEKNQPVAPVLVQSHHLISGDAEGNVYVTNWSTSSTRTNLLGQQKHPSPVLAVQGLPNDYIASACVSGELRIWNLVPDGRNSKPSSRNASSHKAVLKTHKPFIGTRGGGGITCMVLAQSRGGEQWSDVSFATDSQMDAGMSSPENSASSSWLLAVGGTRGGLKVYHGDTEHPGSSGGVEVMSVESPDRDTISSIHLLGSLSHSAGKASATFTGHLPTSANNSANNTVQSFNNLLKYSVQSRIQSILSSPGSRGGGEQARPTSSGYLFAGSCKGAVSIFDMASALSNDACVFTSPDKSSHTALVSGVTPVPFSGSKHVVSGGYDRLVKFWDTRVSGRGSCCTDLVGATGAVTHVDIDDLNPHRIIGVSSDNVIRIWDTRFLRGGESHMSFHVGHVDRICEVMQIEGMLLTAGRDGTVISWNLSTGQCIQTLNCQSSSVFDGYKRGVESTSTKTATAVGHASLSSTRLLNIPLLRALPSADADTSDDEGQRYDYMRTGDAFSSVRVKKGRPAIAMLITGDYGGIVKVWKGTAGNAIARR